MASLSSGVLLGSTAALFLSFTPAFHIIVVIIALLIVGLINRKLVAIFLLVTAGILIGLTNASLLIESEQLYERYFNEEVVLSGVVVEDPSIDVDGDTQFRLESVIVEGDEAGGQVWVSTSDLVAIKRSDRVVLSGELSAGFGTIPAAMYRANVIEVIRPDFADIARDARDSFSEGIRAGIQEPEASLGAGFLVGQKTALPEKLDSELRLLGLTHIVVASGYNLTILVRFARRGFERISRFSALALSSGLMYCFALVTGFSPSMTRASLITFLSLLAWYYGRKFHPIVLLLVSAAITVLINPAYAWGDIGWLLSFTSFIGVIMFAPLVHAFFWGDQKPGSIRQVLIETFSAQLLTLPLIAFIFGQYSPLAIVANLLILPLIPLAMALTFVAGVFGLLVPGIAPYTGWPAEMLLKYMTFVVDRLAQLPLAGAEIEFSLTTLILGYIAIFVGMIFMQRRTGFNFRNHNVVE